MITILGAGGAIGNELVRLLAARNQAFRLVGRNPKATPGATEIIAADLMDKDQTIRAVSGSSVVHLLVGLKLRSNSLGGHVAPGHEQRHRSVQTRRSPTALLRQRDMYGRVSGPMTEETPFNPCSRKGEIRARIATTLINEWKAGALTAMIARSADFYGPDTRNAVPNLLVFEPLARKRKASWLVNDTVPHAFTYTPDAAQSLHASPNGRPPGIRPGTSPPLPSADRQRIHRPCREGTGRRTETSCAEPAHAPCGRLVRSARGRILRDALPERGAARVRLQQIHQGVRLPGDPVRRWHPRDGRLFQARRSRLARVHRRRGEIQAHRVRDVKRTQHGPPLRLVRLHAAQDVVEGRDRLCLAVTALRT